MLLAAAVIISSKLQRAAHDETVKHHLKHHQHASAAVPLAAGLVKAPQHSSAEIPRRQHDEWLVSPRREASSPPVS